MELGQFVFTTGFDTSVNLRGDATDYAVGSRNLLPDGVKQSRPFRGLALEGSGARLMVTLRDTYGGLDDVSGDTAKGSLFSSIAEMLVYIGRGQVKVETNSIAGALASSTLRFLLKWNGSYTAPESGPYSAGLPEPSAVQIGVIANSAIYGTPNLTGTVSIKYARLRTITGDRSRSSATSAVLTVTNKAIYAVVPLPAHGQDRHIFFGTRTILGGIGLHYRIARANPFTGNEYTEEDVERTVSSLTKVGTDKLQSATPVFTAGDITKRVANVSGFTISANTTVAEIISPTEIRLSNTITGTTGSVKLIAFAGGIDRSVVLNYLQSDLVEETAWEVDLPSPSGSHAFQLENRMFVASQADSKRPTDADNAGTALIPSFPNNFGSYDYRYPAYIPEKIIDILSDGVDSYIFIAGKNGIYAAQYLNVTDSTPLTITVLLRGEGINNPSNWCVREKAIYAYTSKGNLIRIIDGGVIDKTFAVKVQSLIRNWNQAEVVLGSNPTGPGLAVFYRNQALYFDELTNRWSTELQFKDWFAGNAISATATASRLLVTLENAGVRNAYEFDSGNGSFVCGISQFIQPVPQMQKFITRIKAAAVADRTDKRGFLGVHQNTQMTHLTDCSMTAGSNVLTSATAKFNSEYVGHYLVVKGAGTSGDWFFGRIKEVLSETQVKICEPVVNLASAANKNAVTTISGEYALLGFRIYPIKATRIGTIEIDSGEMYLSGFTSFAVSILMETSGKDAQPLHVILEGDVNTEENWNFPSSQFGEGVT
jgi:hypothetical protein